jgi:hypothetical protein
MRKRERCRGRESPRSDPVQLHHNQSIEISQTELEEDSIAVIITVSHIFKNLSTETGVIKKSKLKF